MTDSTQLADQFLYQCAVKTERPVKISSSKRVIDVSDIQGGYTSGIITLDAGTALNGSNGFASLQDGYIVLPYIITMKNNGANAMTAAANRLSVGLKCGVWNVVDSLEVSLNGQQLVGMEDYKMYWNNLRAQTEWTESEIEKHGADCFLYPDDWSSVAFSQAASSAWNGVINNG